MGFFDAPILARMSAISLPATLLWLGTHEKVSELFWANFCAMSLQFKTSEE